MHAVVASARGARQERVFELRQRRFAAIVVLVRAERPIRPPHCSADSLAAGGEVRHARQLRQTHRGQLTHASRSRVEEPTKNLGLMLVERQRGRGQA
jgi:hypothetical protein